MRNANPPRRRPVTSTSAAPVWREMARRAGDGIEVALLWNGSLNRVKVMVSDGRQCRYLELEGAQPDAFPAFNEQCAQAVSRLPAIDLETDLSEQVRASTRED